MNTRTMAAFAVMLACVALQPARCQEGFAGEGGDVVGESQLRGRQLASNEKVTANRAAGAARSPSAVPYGDGANNAVIENGRTPANDHFSNRIRLQCIPKFIVSSNEDSTVERREPTFSPSRRGPFHTIWYKWLAPTTGNFTFHTRNSTFDTVVNVFRVTSNNFNGLQHLSYNDDCTYAAPVGFVLTSCPDFEAVQDVQYAFQIGGYASNQVGTVQSTITIKGAP